MLCQTETLAATNLLRCLVKGYVMKLCHTSIEEVISRIGPCHMEIKDQQKLVHLCIN